MPRPDKVQAVAEIRERFESAEAVFVTEYRGIAVKQMGDLRRRLREAGAEYKVVKMSLARRAVDELGLTGVGDHLVGPTALAFAQDDPVATAKALRDYSRDDENLVIKLGLLADKVLQPEEVGRLADIEPREVLLAKIAGAAKAPLTAVAGMVSSFTRDAAGLFAALLDKKESEAPVETDAVPEADVSEAPETEASETEASETEAPETDASAEKPETEETTAEESSEADATASETEDDAEPADPATEASAETETPQDEPVDPSEEETTAEAEEE